MCCANLNWAMKFTHELTHTIVALFCFAKINEFVVRNRECYVNGAFNSVSDPRGRCSQSSVQGVLGLSYESVIKKSDDQVIATFLLLYTVVRKRLSALWCLFSIFMSSGKTSGVR